MTARAAARRSVSSSERPLALGTVFAMRERHAARLQRAVVAALGRRKISAGLTDGVLAARLGMSTDDIRRFVTMQERWSIEQMIDILTAAGLEIDRLRISPV